MDQVFLFLAKTHLPISLFSMSYTTVVVGFTFQKVFVTTLPA